MRLLPSALFCACVLLSHIQPASAQETPEKLPVCKAPCGYAMTISDRSRYVYFRVGKAGTRSLLWALGHNTEFSQHGAGMAFEPAAYTDYFKFAFVRNPWARVVSCYCNKVGTGGHPAFRECFGKGFEYFVDFIDRLDVRTIDRHLRAQTSLVPVDEVDFIGRIENFDEDFQYVMKTLGIEGLETPHRCQSAHEHYSTYYTERTREIIARKYKDDIETFGYSFEELDATATSDVQSDRPDPHL